jgi:type II secretory pathway pseudopilin PulG
MKNLNTKKAAMFGLDARIALAIFGALSVISGAALYSAIQQSKVTMIAAQLNEILKAAESYTLDTGLDLPMDTSSAEYRTKIASLITNTNNVKNWNGPYLSFSESSIDTPGEDFINFKGYRLYTGIYQKNVTSNASWTDYINVCEAGETCYVVAAISNVNTKMLSSLDLYFDGVESPSTGRFRTVGSWGWLIGYPSLKQP